MPDAPQFPEFLDEGRAIQRRAEILRAYAERPLGQRLGVFLKGLDLGFGEWQRMLGNRAFRSNVTFIDRERVRFSTAHITDAVADVLDVQFNLALRGDPMATQRILQAAQVINQTAARATDDYEPRFVESFANAEAERPLDLEAAREQESESRDMLDEMLANVDAETGDEPVDLTRRD